MIEPLPEERIQEMFNRIRKNEKIELTLVYQALILRRSVDTGFHVRPSTLS